jgi:hypothetical protein
VRSFDVDDLYRAAWVQAVAAVDHWVKREVIERGVWLAQQPTAARPAKFNKLSISVELFERMHHGDEPLGEVFRARLEEEFRRTSFHGARAIADGFGHVSTVKLWPKVSQLLSGRYRNGDEYAADTIRRRLDLITGRRNQIAHTADRDPDRPSGRASITADETESHIDWLEIIAGAVQEVLGDPVQTTDYDAGPDQAGPVTGNFSGPHETKLEPMVPSSFHWDEPSLLDAIQRSCSSEVAENLLRIYRHAEAHQTFCGYYFGTGKSPSVTPWFELGDSRAAVWSIYTGERKSVLAINFEWMRNRGADARLEPLARSLSKLPGWGEMPEWLAESNFARRPSIGPEILSKSGVADLIIQALDTLLQVGDGVE